MPYTDDSSFNAEYTLLMFDAGVNFNGEKMFRLAEFALVRLKDNTDSAAQYVMPLPWANVLAEADMGMPRCRMDQVSGAIPAPQATDTDQRALHFFGPL